MAKHTLLTQRPSANRKTGPVFCLYRPVHTTCPKSCPISKFCYGGAGLAFLAGEKARGKSVDLKERYAKLKPGALIRHNVVGDFFVDGELDHELIAEVREAHEAFPSIDGWGYTHGWRQIDPSWLSLPNLTVRASCETDAAVEEAKGMGWRCAKVVVPGYQRKGTEVFCAHETRGVQCASCTICRRSSKTVLFTAHGYRKAPLIRFLA